MTKKKTVKKATRKPKHVPEYVALGGHSDAYRCSCGWQSNGYWDLVEAAFDEWLLHAHETKTPIEEQYVKRQQRMVREHDERQRRTLSRVIAQGFVGTVAFGTGEKRK